MVLRKLQTLLVKLILLPQLTPLQLTIYLDDYTI